MFTKRFFLGWILSSLAMFSASYVWHGIVLTDFDRLALPKNVFLLIALVVYLVIGFGLSYIFKKVKTDKLHKSHPVRGSLIGMAAGIFLYLVSLVVGISIIKEIRLTYVVMDLGWQMIEQALGGLLIGLTWVFVFEPDFEEGEV